MGDILIGLLLGFLIACWALSLSNDVVTVTHGGPTSPAYVQWNGSVYRLVEVKNGH